MNEHGYCPHCNADLDGGDIPEDIAHHYSGKKWGRALGIEVRGAYDGILIWQCPDCKGYWPRFPADTWERLYNRAVNIIEGWKNAARADKH